MDFLGYSNLNPLLILFSFGVIGGIFSFIGTIGKALFGGGAKGTGATAQATKQIDYQKIIDDQKRDFERQMSLQAQESKKTMMMIGIGGGILVFILIMFMMIGKK